MKKLIKMLVPLIFLMKIYYATSNSGKVRSLQRYFEGTKVEVCGLKIPFSEPRFDSVKEIARSKAVHAHLYANSPVVAQDSGFFVSSLNGFPNTYVNSALKTIGLEGILKLADGKDRSCEFRDCMAYLDNECDNPEYFVSTTIGVLSSEIKGVRKDYHWSELSRIFIPEGCNKTLAEMNEGEFKLWNSSKRQSSSKSFADWYLGWNKAAKI